MKQPRRLIPDLSGFGRGVVETQTKWSLPQPTPFVPGRLPRQVYHLAEEANFPSIQRHGLLSASALLDLAGIHGEQRVRLERRQRPVHTKLGNGTYMRDQNPMPAHALAGCLIGMEPENWYALINSKVFFWFDAQRMDRQRRACGRRPQMLMVVDTKRLLDCYAEVAALSPINSGHARRKPAVRGRNTFVPYPLWCQSGWDSETAGLGTRPRPRSHRPVELTIEGAVPDIMDFVIHVQQSAPNEPLVDLDDSIAQRTSLLNCDAGRPFGSGSGR